MNFDRTHRFFFFERYLVIPFLLELRTIMDWMFTDTALGLSSWLQLEDIYSNVYLLKCARWAEKVKTKVNEIRLFFAFSSEISNGTRCSKTKINQIRHRWFIIGHSNSSHLVSITFLFVHIVILSAKSSDRSECRNQTRRISGLTMNFLLLLTFCFNFSRFIKWQLKDKISFHWLVQITVC